MSNIKNSDNQFNIALPDVLDELKQLRQWVSYKTVERGNNKLSKIPINPNTGSNAQINDLNTWGSYEEAINSVNKYNLVGIGFVFSNNYTGIDLDNVVSNNIINNFALDIVKQFNSYTEYSPSGTGLHILCKNSFNIGNRNDKLGIEIYNHSRFFTITGNVYENIKPIEERTEQVKRIYEIYFKKSSTHKIRTSLNTLSISEDDKELWNIIFNKEHIKLLFNGDISKYDNDHSRADLALCSYLARYTNGNIERIDRMFRQSKLMRDKWDEQRGDRSYGMMTIEKSLENYNNVDKKDCILDYLDNHYENELTIFKNSMPSELSWVFELFYNGYSRQEISILLDIKLNRIKKIFTRIREHALTYKSLFFN